MAGALEPARRCRWLLTAPKPADVAASPTAKPGVKAKPVEARPPKPAPNRKPEAKLRAKATRGQARCDQPHPNRSDSCTTDDEGRFVVQIGAFAEAASA